jgi:LL-diaminopimelate aminotransferase
VKRTQRLVNAPSYPFARWTQYSDAVRQRGVEVIRLDIGSPDLAPPDEVIDALCKSAQQPDHHSYPGYRGVPALRQAIVDYYKRRFNVTLDPKNHVLPLIGSKEGIVNMSLACLDRGDIVLVPDPGYAPYTMGARLAGADVRTFPLLPECGFLADLDSIPPAVADEAVLMWLNYPNNPTGATASLEHLEKAVDLARRHNMLLCHDAPYTDVTYDGYVAPSLLQIPGAQDVAVEFNSLSKTWNMAGWRVGMAVGNAAALSALAQIKSNFDSGIFRPLQDAAARALAVEPQWVSVRNGIYRERLEIVLNGLNAAGIEAPRPRATLYVWARIPTHSAASGREEEAAEDDAELTAPDSPSEAFALSLLQATGVAVAPGSFFGPGGEGYVRISVTAPTPKVQEAMLRIQEFLTSIWHFTER